jgi:hypothetical protein
MHKEKVQSVQIIQKYKFLLPKNVIKEIPNKLILKVLSNGAGGGPKLVSIDPF